MKRIVMACVLATMLVAAAAGETMAVDKWWIGGNRGDFLAGGNWRPNGRPGVDDTAIFQVRKNVDMEVRFSNDITIKELKILNGKVTFNLNGKTCTVTEDAGILVGFEKTNRDYESAEFTILNGKLKGSGVVANSIRGPEKGFARLTVGEGGRWDMESGSVIGEDGEAVVTIEKGGRIDGESLTLANKAGSRADITVTGKSNDAPSTLSTTSLFSVGSNGVAHITVSRGARLDTYKTTIGAFRVRDKFSAVSIDGTGSLWDLAGKLLVGSAGVGKLHVKNGGRLTVNDNRADPMPTVAANSELVLDGGEIAVTTVRAAGTLRILGSMTAGSGASKPTGNLKLERGCVFSIEGTRTDLLRLKVGGTMTLNGTVWVTRNGFNPEGGRWYTLVSAAEMDGAPAEALEWVKGKERGDMPVLTARIVTTGAPHTFEVKWPGGGAPDGARAMDLAAMPEGAPPAFALRLAGANPRPATDGIEATYEIPASGAGHLAIDLYDVSGRRVLALVNDEARGGRYRARASGDDLAGLATGIYFLRMDAGSFHRTERITLMR